MKQYDTRSIATELRHRCKSIHVQKIRSKNALEDLQKNLNRFKASTPHYVKEIERHLNAILNEKGIELNESEKEKFVSEIQPTVADILQELSAKQLA